MLSEPDIVEADFSGFFNEVTHYGLTKVMHQELKFTDPMQVFVRKLIQSLVQLPEEVKLPEPHQEYAWLEQYTKGLTINQDLLGNILKRNDRYNFSGKGVPQGAPISCSLATLALRKLVKFVKAVLYADDGLYFGKIRDM